MNARTPAVAVEPDAFRSALRAELGDERLDLSVDRDGYWTVLGDVTQEQVDAFVSEHYPDTADPDEEFRAAIEGATSVADLKAALLGTSGPGAEPRRGRR